LARKRGTLFAHCVGHYAGIHQSIGGEMCNRPSVRLTRGCAFPCFHLGQISNELRLLRLTKSHHKKYRRRARAVVQLQPGVRVTARFPTWTAYQRARLALSTVGQSAMGHVNVRSETEFESMAECRHLKTTEDLFEIASIHLDEYSAVMSRHGRNGGTYLDYFAL